MKILITGGSSDIGHAIASRRIKLKDEVVVTTARPESLEKSLISLRQEDPKTNGFIFNFQEPEKCKPDLDQILASGLDALILNAFEPVPQITRFDEMPFEKIRTYMRTNIEANLWLLHHVLPAFKKQKFGRLILISSLSSVVGTPNYGVYASSKSALEALFLNLAVDYGLEGITSNILRLGLIKTSRTALFWKREEYRTKMSAAIPQGQLGEPSQVAEALDPFLSKSSYLNGSILNVGGGLPLTTMGRLS